MATNLFEKYGIKEVADVTLYRIDRKEETYESQRKISISSILKGALTKQMVYPLDEDGQGSADGFEAYVFKDADVLTHYNYDCDDEISINGSGIYVDIDDLAADLSLRPGQVLDATDPDQAAVIEAITADIEDKLFDIDPDNNVILKSCYANEIGRDMTTRVKNLIASGRYEIGVGGITVGDAISYRGTTNNVLTAGEDDLVLYRAYLVPETYVLEDSNALPDTITENDNVLSGYIDFAASRNATGDELREAIKTQQIGLYEDLGIIIRFKQVEKIGTPVETDKKYSGTVKFNWTDSGDPASGSIIYTLAGAILTDEVYASIVNGTVTTATLDALVDDDTVRKTGDAPVSATVVFGEQSVAQDTGDEHKKFAFTFSTELVSSEEAATGYYAMIQSTDLVSTPGHWAMDPDIDEAGTHEFSYAEQVCMLFAKNQNLITKAGTRYQFANAEELFGAFDFDDTYASAPNGVERVVVVGLAGKTAESLYDFDEINDAIKELTSTFEAKAYTITYTDYAELVVEDEMGYYLPQQLGGSRSSRTGEVTFFAAGQYESWARARKGIDPGIQGAVNTWGDATHYSINDAIDALKQEKQVLDVAGEVSATGYDRVFGGYKVRGKSIESTLPIDDIGRGAMYEDYTINGQTIYDFTGAKLSSSYALDDVIAKLSIANITESGDLRISSTIEQESNRAIYVDSANGVIANRALIYLLKNVKSRALVQDQDGIFEFTDKKGNKLYYQDKVFKGVANLALVIIGTKGLVFVVNRYSKKNFDQVAWMINDNGYLTDNQAVRLVKNGLIHTVSVTACDETFDATCTVGAIKVRKTKKSVLHYVPVLFLDTLKVSTLEQATETTDARGGRGNAKLITWDYGKEITLSIEDALYTPASMAAIWAGENGDLTNGVKDANVIDRFQKYTAKKNFIVPAGNSEGTPTEGNMNSEAVYYDPKTMKPYQDGTPITVGEVYYKFTRSVAYGENALGKKIEISADKFPGTYRVVGETCVRQKEGGKDQRFQFIIPEAKMSASDATITLEAEGDPTVFSFSMTVLRPESGNMMEFVQFDIEDNDEQGDGSDMVKNTEDLNFVDEAEVYKVSGGEDEELVIGATEY